MLQPVILRTTMLHIITLKIEITCNVFQSLQNIAMKVTAIPPSEYGS